MWLWSITTIDIAFIILVIIAAGVLLLFFIQSMLSKSRELRWTKFARAVNRRRITGKELVTAILTVIGIYIAYGTLRNQLRAGAEAERNANAYILLGWEKDRPYIRCLYTWYSTRVSTPDCLQEILGSSGNYSEVMTYIEEVIWILQASKNDAELYGSSYSDDIDFWRDDVQEDPTGLFAFHLINRYGLSQVTTETAKAGLCFPDLCVGYERARLALASRGFNVDQPNVCRTPQSRQMLRMNCR